MLRFGPACRALCEPGLLQLKAWGWGFRAQLIGKSVAASHGTAPLPCTIQTAIKFMASSTAFPPPSVGQQHQDQQLRSAKVAVAQMTSHGDQEENFQIVARLCQDAAASSASILFLPECFSFIGVNQAETVAAMQPLDGPLMRRYCALALQHKLWLSLGGFQETGPDSGHLFNCHVVISADGAIKARYRKVHLFNVEVQNGPVLMESRSTAPGNELVTCDSPAGRLGLSTCYDVRFPEMYQQLAFGRGAEVLLVPSAFTKLTGKAHWELLLRARAVETQCFVIAAAQAGVHNAKRESYGDSIIVDPWGEVVARLPDPLATGIAVADLDFEKMYKIRERMPMADHRRQGRISLGWDAPEDASEASFAPPT